MNKRAPSSVGTNQEGLVLNKYQAPTQIPSNKMTMTHEYFMLLLTPLTYLAVNFSKRRSNQRKNLSRRFFFFSGFVGFNNSVHRAGVSDKAMNAEMMTEMAMVMANCWYSPPTMPGIKPTGTNTAANIRAMATTGADISFMA